MCGRVIVSMSLFALFFAGGACSELDGDADLTSPQVSAEYADILAQVLDDSISSEAGAVEPVEYLENLTCFQTNALDSDGCCCHKSDPTEAYKSAHVLDLGVQEVGTELFCCLSPGLGQGCQDTAYFDVSLDGNEWTELTSFPTVSSPKPGGGWIAKCQTKVVEQDFRYVRGANEKCYVDFFECSWNPAD